MLLIVDFFRAKDAFFSHLRAAKTLWCFVPLKHQTQFTADLSPSAEQVKRRHNNITQHLARVKGAEPPQVVTLRLLDFFAAYEKKRVK